MSAELYQQHREQLDRAVAATSARAYWTPYPETPSTSSYGPDAADAGLAAFRGHLGSTFDLDQPAITGWVGEEVSPYGLDLHVRYPRSAPEALVAAARSALPRWRDAGPQARAGVALEILRRLNERSFEIAHAVMHTTGQPFLMAFQAGGPHAQDRGLEAVAYAYAEMTRQAERSVWRKPGRSGDVCLEKTFTVVPRGIALVIACNTFPTWNGYPGLFASLVTGNPVIVKPHRRAVLPLAITVRVARQVLAEAGFDPNLVTLAVETADERLATTLATRPEVRVVDFTGSSDYGCWLEANATQAVVYAEKAGLNTVVIDSTDDYRGLLRNLAFSLSLYSGQMCTTPQNIFVPAGGIDTDAGHRSVDELSADLAEAVQALLADDARAVEVLGAIVNDSVRQRLDEAPELGDNILASRAVTHPQHPGAAVRTPVIVRLDAGAEKIYGREWFGPVSFVIVTESTQHSLELMRATITAHGALTALVHSSDPAVLQQARSAAIDAGVHLSENLTQGVFVNQSAAFSDFHGSAANPAASATLTDAAFVTGRFFVLQSRRHLPAAQVSADA